MASPNGRKAHNAPYRRAVAVTPSDSTVLEQTDAISVGGAGTVIATMAAGGSPITLTLTAGIHRIALTKVGASSSATGICALYLQDS